MAETSRRYLDDRESVQKKRITVMLAGIAIIRQRPGTAKGIVFITLEDETGVCNLIIRPQVFERHRRAIISSSVLMARGRLQFVGDIVYLETSWIRSLDPLLLPHRDVNFPNNSYSY